jgi:hypothetical protein
MLLAMPAGFSEVSLTCLSSAENGLHESTKITLKQSRIVSVQIM